MELTQIELQPVKRNELPITLDTGQHTLLFVAGLVDYSTVLSVVERGRVIYEDYIHLGLHQSAVSDAHRQQVDNAYIVYLRTALKSCGD